MWVYLTLLLLSLSGLDLVPLSTKDIDISIPDDLDHNSIDGDGEDIDLSSLGPDAYGTPNNDSGDSLSTWSESSLMNPEEMGNYGQGDILMPPHHARNGMKDKTSRWPNGIIPYSIDGLFTQEQKDTIMRAIADYHRLTCLRFVPYNGQTDYISITSANTGCWSSVGRIGSRQEVNLQTPGCLSKKGTVLHEILHAVGFTHEQSRPERDDYVTINYNNVKPGSENNFKKSDSSYTSGYGVPYDYNSVMHYSEYAFSRNSKKTIEPKVGGVKLGQRDGLSRGDVRKVNAMYNCKKQEPQSGWLSEIWQNIFGGNDKKLE
ncbi:hatching enzyme 1.2 [Papilio machaon]|uniref:hatching enzyme 1.2 n=1 Tax=Papilio machaon TaxID=76193 RepID=UPI001E663EEC|nr:hatching enzyme 1.2 [Papilio machaon]